MTTATDDRHLFRETVALVAEKARARLPQAVNGRVESAVKLVLLHDVTPQVDGSILVGSSTDPLKTYRLMGTTCTCQDFAHGKAPDGWCSHRIAAGIDKRVRELLPLELPCEPFPDNDPGPVEELPPTPPAPLPCPEAVFSLTLKGTRGGVDALLTVRGMTAAAFTANLQAVHGLLDAPQLSAQSSRTGEGWCTKHALQMRFNRGKDGKPDWYSHRTAEGQWCQGR
jgi:hypothetical protein